MRIQKIEMVASWGGWGNEQQPNVDIIQQTPTLPGGKSAIDTLNLCFGWLDLQGSNVVIDTSKSGYFDRPGTIAYENWTNYRRKFPDTKILLSVGGAGNVTFFREQLTGRARETAEVIAKKVLELGLDGVDMDPEYVDWQNPEHTKQANKNFRELAIELRKLLPHKKITWSVFADHSLYKTDNDREYGLFNFPEFMKVFDEINIMAYHDGVPFQERLEQWAQYFLKEKLILGNFTGEHSPELMKARSLYVRENKNGGAFLWALTPELRQPNRPFFEFLRNIYAGLQGWRLTPENSVEMLRQALSAKVKALKENKSPQFFSTNKKEMDKLIEYVSLVATTGKIQNGELVSPKEFAALANAWKELTLELPQNLALFKEYCEKTDSDLLNTISKIEQGEPLSDKESQKVETKWYELGLEMLSANVQFKKDESKVMNP